MLPVLLVLQVLPGAIDGATAADEPVRYVSDELVIVMREGPSASSPVTANLNTGTRMRLLESDTRSGYGRVQLDDGRSGWVQERYLVKQPPVRDRAAATGKSLDQARAELAALRDEHAKLLKEFARVTEGRPPPPPEDLTRELEQLRVRAQDLSAQNEKLQAAAGTARERQRTLALGGGLVAAGFVLAWLVRWLWPKRRWGDL